MLQRAHVGRLQVLGALAGLGDVVTTAVGLARDPGLELNVVLGRLAASSVPLAVAAVACLVVALLVVSVYGRPWERRVAGSYLVLAMGVGTANNVCFLATGFSVLATFGPRGGSWLVAYGFPIAGLAVGTVLAGRAGVSSWPRAATLSALVCATIVGLPVLAGVPAAAPG